MKKLALILSLSFAFFSCTKEDNPVNNSLTDSDLLLASTQTSFGDNLDINYSSQLSDDYSSYSSSKISESTTDVCAVISIDNANPGEFPKTISVNFGTGCEINGITRSGTLTITLTDYVMNYGSTMTIVRGNDYYINGYKFEGTIVYENITTNVNLPEWTRDLTNGKITTSSGSVYTYTDSRSMQLIEGVGTATLTDNTYKAISGTRTVVRPDASTLTCTVLTPLIKSYSCAYISEGSLDLQGTFLDGVLDYGNGACDASATYTHSNGQVFSISL